MEPIIKVQDVQYCTLQCPDLDIQEQFLIHFGMHTVEKTDEMLLMKGDGTQPFIEKVLKGEKKFISLAFVASSMEDLEKISKTEAFSDVEELNTPGGGFVSKGHDLDGFGVEVVYGIESLEEKTAETIPTNEGRTVNRVNQMKRFLKGSYPRILRFAHAGLNAVNVKESFEWYQKHLGFIASDRLFLGDPKDPNTPLQGIFSRLDKGKEPADHHTVFFLSAPLLSEGKPVMNHVSFEMFNIDDVFTGNEMLESKKEEFNYFQEWGIGRHYQGSQLFDYWRNPFGQTHEHQTDGDMFDNTFPTRDLNVITDEAGLGQEPAESQWGPALSNTFGNAENG
ncbi:VOC family protein [SAR86 cluster bacterium]|jgi:catechol 2,3-dioxygenase-like lactoylglutathione lyase family enzyme|nr:VOC family protein [SAR86 cluster bacterium]MEC8107988.1 VOC family protein [Pseudomonadota bacterium]|tara:strand:+ start:27 stop:1037 length:1011 start_codon:yes stop_codon:yes gene_type:complete